MPAWTGDTDPRINMQTCVCAMTVTKVKALFNQLDTHSHFQSREAGQASPS